MSPQKRSDLYLAGLLHDVGKIGIDDQVLKKRGPLTPDEYRMIQAHVEIGVTILKDLKKLSHILPGVRHHHESLDGTEYPDRLSGEQIPLEARIIAVADCSMPCPVTAITASDLRPCRSMTSSTRAGASSGTVASSTLVRLQRRSGSHTREGSGRKPHRSCQRHAGSDLIATELLADPSDLVTRDSVPLQ